MIRRPPRSTLSSSSAASDVYKRQRLHELHDLIEQYKVEESKRRMANNQVIQDLQAGALWEEIGKQMGGLTRELNEFREEVQAQVQDITASLDKVSDAAGEARSLLEEDLQLEEERRDREAKSELAQRGEALHGVVEQIKGEIKQMKATADSQIQFSTDSMLETVDAQMTEAQSSARENQEQLQQQQTETEQILREFGHKIRTVGPVSYTHLRAHETPEHLVCRLLLEKKKKTTTYIHNPDKRLILHDCCICPYHKHVTT
eukprot:TRINITY_DN18541_c0_g1_i1.p1 TRINITY_DN18541_c0_g1~~TRINITY_DN18541_c0_g1_i1.p1  ORF type:complete len:260 (+),score=86.05 TRINITY_DN18541_c0_g1_i1:155-934(+)